MATKSDARMRRMAAQMHALAAVRREIRSRDTVSNCKYLREFNDAYPTYDATLTPEQLDQRLTAADILLVGDYHALPASQHFAAGVVELLAHGRPLILGVEAILARSQQVLDAWWRREISEQNLRERLQFDHEWGYEWTPFYELLITARENADAIYGLDCMPRADLRRIRSRDRHAAAKICEMRKQHPNARIVVLFGESHMAPQHLPRVLYQFLPRERILTVLQNVDSLHWRATDEGAQAVSIGGDVVAVISASPLEKYESYRMCFERWSAASEDQPDFAPAVYNVILSLARAVGFRLNSPRNGTQPKFLIDSLPEVVSEFTENANLASRLGLQGCAYLGETNTFFIREFHTAEVAAEAARFLHWACRGMRLNSNLDIENALAYFGARLLCPGPARSMCVQEDADPEPDKVTPQFIGERLYQSYLEGRVRKAQLRQLFLSHLEGSEPARDAGSSLLTLIGIQPNTSAETLAIEHGSHPRHSPA